MHKSLINEISKGKYEYDDEGGLYLPESRVHYSNVYSNDVRRNGELLGVEYSKNTVVTEGLNHTLSTELDNGTQVSQWYLGIFSGNYTPQATDTGANIASNSTESSTYSEGIRQNLTLGTAAAGSINNTASRAEFSINGTVTIYGAFCISTSTISDTAGVLFSASKYATSRSLISGDILIVGYTATVADA